MKIKYVIYIIEQKEVHAPNTDSYDTSNTPDTEAIELLVEDSEYDSIDDAIANLEEYISTRPDNSTRYTILPVYSSDKK